ncbi:hypothetical protein JTB14_009731 [Gonioctena quinquepunctata]|nr:hypothetical protein JTB14_009731 [Gonioctena quinquepunctata]
MATVDSYRSVCDRFNIGRATAWPSGDRAIDVMQGFEIASRFPKVIGAIDGTHIHIDSPKENAADYINRKGFHSIQLQLVCDHKTSIHIVMLDILVLYMTNEFFDCLKCMTI